jgi:membrane protein
MALNLPIKWRDVRTAVMQSAPIRYIQAQWKVLPFATRRLPVHMLQAFLNFKSYGMRNAASLAYYAVFSVFPLTLLIAVAVSAILGPTVAREQIYEGLRLFLPENADTLNLFQDSIAQAVAQGTGFGLFALIGLVWSALGLFSNLTSALDRIFQVAASRGMWKERLLAFVMTFGLIVLVGTSFITSGVLRLADTFLLANSSVWIRIGTFFLPFGLNMVIFILLFRFVPSRYVSWDAVWPAAILGAVSWELAKQVFAAYLGGLANYQFVYGGITTAIVLMVWAYLMAGIFLICAEICSQLNLWLLDIAEDETRVSVFVDADLERLPEEIPPPM